MRGVTLNPHPVSVCRKLYWLDEGGPGVPRKVAAANLDGSESEILVKDDLTHLDFLSLDVNTQTLYWSEGHAGKVSRSRWAPGGS